ncbi:unnamed protein product [Durusdinium trenchii]|uniref:Uncharacterized protein n=1 Tax=Durusdinium trenchii TaxID=1381693 RepID=A0ABP0QIA6_9DINO
MCCLHRAGWAASLLGFSALWSNTFTGQFIAKRQRLVQQARGAVEEVLPIGPFCPFTSPSLRTLCTEPEQRQKLETILSRIDELAETTAEPHEYLRLGGELRDADSVWRGNLLHMRHSADFQTQELYEFTEAHLEKLGVSIVEVERFAIWQADALEAMGRSRPVPGPEVDPASEKAQHLRGLLDSFRFGSWDETRERSGVCGTTWAQ